jgi:membrane associated rhomboid family serine protease
MIPLQDNIRARRPPLMNYAIIIVNVLLLVYQMRLPEPALEAFLTRHGAIPSRFLGDTDIVQIGTLVSSIFLHGGWLHLVSNMWALFIFGDNIEDRMGPVRYLLFYVVAGMIAGMVHIYLHASSALPVIGASGAIAGVMGAYLITYPRARVITLVPIGFLWFVQIPAVIYLGLWFALQLFSGVQTLAADAVEDAVGGVAWWAHIGGFVAGMILIKVLQSRRTYAVWHADEYRPW